MKCIDACTKNREEYIHSNVPERCLQLIFCGFSVMKYYVFFDISFGFICLYEKSECIVSNTA